jgi:hypothetical protein
LIDFLPLDLSFGNEVESKMCFKKFNFISKNHILRFRPFFLNYNGTGGGSSSLTVFSDMTAFLGYIKIPNSAMKGQPMKKG